MPKLVPLAAVGLLLATAVARADTEVTPSWLKVDAASRKAVMDVVAAANDNNNNWNFNGYHSGEATIVVPLGWTVEIAFRNQESEIPHSLVVMADPGDETKYPTEAGEAAAAFPRAHTKNPVEGVGEGDDDTVSFKADKVGDYLWYCGVAGHGQSGMWTRFKVANGLDAPIVVVAAGADPGRE